MYTLIDAAIQRSRAVILLLVLLLVIGGYAYNVIPKEMDPDVQIPIIYLSMTHEGISPEDAERLLIRPMEKELRNIEGVKEMRATATQGFASVMLEFHAGFDSDKALLDVREKVDLAKPELPQETDEPTVNEVNLSLFPVVNVILTGNIPEHSFISIANDLKNKLEGIHSILSVDIAGEREEAVDIIIDPLITESYGLTADVITLVSSNNTLIAAGALDTGEGSYQIKVPGLLEDLEDILTLPVKVNDEAVVTIGDIASVRKSFKDPEGFARVNGKPALVLEVSKRTGENIIDTIDKVHAVVEETRQYWPPGIQVFYAQDKSGTIRTIVNELQNNIIFAILLVVVVVIYFIGIRSATLVSIAIPGAFLTGILVLFFLDLTLNIVVLFSLILSIGMLVDSAIIVIEYANRKMIDGMSHKQAYGEAAKRMAWPIIASTVTTLLVFGPLLFWPGIIGQFMKYLPLTLIATLSGSLVMALIFLPTLGSWLGRSGQLDEDIQNLIHTAESGDLNELKGFTGSYTRLLNGFLSHAGKFIFLMIAVLVGVIFLFITFGAGSEFFPDIEPENAQLQIRARGNLSVIEKDRLVREVETRILDMEEEVRVFYTRSGKMKSEGAPLPEDTIGLIQLEFEDWQQRRKAMRILEEMKQRTSDLPGIVIEARKQEEGPAGGKPIDIEISSQFPELLPLVIEKIVAGLRELGGVVDITDSRPVPGIEWQMDVNRKQAARFGVNIETIGSFIKLVSNGLQVSSYRPNESDDEVDIMLRFPKKERDLRQLDRLRVVTSQGAIPLTNFVERKPLPKLSQIERVNGLRTLGVKADVEEGVLPNTKVTEIMKWLKEQELDPRISIRFKGDQEEQAETGTFLRNAFVLALTAMTLVLLMQFNSLYHTFIIMSAVFLSTIGVLLGLLITGQPFGVVMCGVGIIALGGIVVNNNIIFIDTYQKLRQDGMEPREAILRTGAQRMRPILLTAGTTVLGLLPMVIQMNIDFITREVMFGAPSTQWWVQLSTSIAGGLSFATILTLFFTPCLLMLGARWFGK